VEIDRFFIKEKLESELLKLSHVVTGNQIAYCLIKELSSINLMIELSSINLMMLCDKMDLMYIFVHIEI
jgi:homospermidine synthase